MFSFLQELGRQPDDRRPRYNAASVRHHEVTARFRAACAGGDLNVVMELLGVLAKPESAGAALEPATINAEPGLLITLGGQTIGTVSLGVSDGLVRHVRLQLNPDKLRGVNPP